MNASIKTLATKEDLAQIKYDLSKEISGSLKWMFIFWVGQGGAMPAVLLLFLKR